MSISNDTIISISNEVQRITNEQNDTNLLDTVYVNENAHSRILRMILSYCFQEKYPFYELFLKIPKIATILPRRFEGGFPRFFNERDRIDLLIEGKDLAYAIIVENKIKDAGDRDRQLERYLLSCKERGFRNDCLYAVYLTSDGSKRVSDISLTDTAKSILGINSSSGRFSEISFKEDIIPWLEESILVSKDMSVQVHAALVQYEDYLLEQYGKTGSKITFELNMKDLLEKNGINDISAFSEHIDAVNKLYNELIAHRDKHCLQLAAEYISPVIKAFCEDENIKYSEEYSYQFLSIRITIPELKNSTFHFHTEGGGRNIYGISNIDVNQGDVLPEETWHRYSQLDYKQSPWWPAYKYPKDSRYLKTGTTEFWKIWVMDKSFAEYIKELYREVVDILRHS